jgi:hypothetical protein
MWKNEKCLIINFLEGLQEPKSEETTEIGSPNLYREAEAVPKWLKVATPKALAKEILEFKDEEFAEDEQVSFHMISQLFWNKKGVDSLFMPTDIQMKIQQANIKARRQLMKDEEKERKARLAKEKEELPSIVCQCADWARLGGLKRVTYSDIDAFMLEKDMDVLKETRRALYSKTNLTMKTGK